MGEQIHGYLVLNVLEATARNKDEQFTWDSNSFDAFVKGGGVARECMHAPKRRT